MMLCIVYDIEGIRIPSLDSCLYFVFWEEGVLSSLQSSWHLFSLQACVAFALLAILFSTTVLVPQLLTLVLYFGTFVVTILCLYVLDAQSFRLIFLFSSTATITCFVSVNHA
jgi:hypothetical protein